MAKYQDLTEWHPAERRNEVRELVREIKNLSDEGHTYIALEKAEKLVYLLKKSNTERREKLTSEVA